MTTQQDQLIDIAKRGQETVAAALESWKANVQKFADSISATPAAVPELKEIVDGVYDFADQILAKQREFAHSVLAAHTEATETAVSQAREATETVVNQAREATETVVNQTVEAAKATTERATAATRAARNSTKA